MEQFDSGISLGKQLLLEAYHRSKVEAVQFSSDWPMLTLRFIDNTVGVWDIR